jgi:hypothetical protein
MTDDPLRVRVKTSTAATPPMRMAIHPSTEAEVVGSMGDLTVLRHVLSSYLGEAPLEALKRLMESSQ